MLREGLNEILTFGSIKSDPLNCTKGNFTIENNPIILPVENTNSSNYTSDIITYIESNETFLNNTENTEKISENITEIISNETLIKDIIETSETDNNIIETILTDQINNSSSYSSSSDTSSTSDSYSNIVIIPISLLDNAIQRSKLTVSFRQINQFTSNSGTINFKLYALTTEPIEAGEKVKLNVNLIKENGEREDKIQEASCILLEGVSPKEGESIQGDFNCSINNLKEEYYSLRLTFVIFFLIK